jgi:sec-independent protein translocase protein TatC
VKTTTKASKKNRARQLSRPTEPVKLAFIEHFKELRKRIFYIVVSVSIWATATYFVQQHIVSFLLKPAHNQQFIYTSVGGGIDFLVRVCLYTGIVFSIPVIVYQLLQYLSPLIKRDAMGFMGRCSFVSGILALAGMAFGYFLGLPSALDFLLHQFTTDQIHPLLTIQSYMSFVTAYLFGSALLFQLPLVLIIINRIQPLNPKKLLAGERWVILVAFVLGGIMNPSPRVQDQLILAVPMILAYQVGVLIIWRMNRKARRPRRFEKLLTEDEKARAQRLALAPQLAVATEPIAEFTAMEQVLSPAQSAPITAATKTSSRPITRHNPGRARYFNDFGRPVRQPKQTANTQKTELSSA